MKLTHFQTIIAYVETQLRDPNNLHFINLMQSSKQRLTVPENLAWDIDYNRRPYCGNGGFYIKCRFDFGEPVNGQTPFASVLIDFYTVNDELNGEWILKVNNEDIRACCGKLPPQLLHPQAEAA